jgi:tRNA-specific 2-thiouridylase
MQETSFHFEHPTLRPGARVAVGLSGGVDSSMTAWLLKRRGFGVIGLTMSIWDNAIPLPDEGHSGCFGPGESRDIEAAAAFAARMGIEHHVIRLAAAYRETVLDYFRSEYRAGRTPNPCVQCNRRMKFGFLLDHARARGLAFDVFATGHYARTDRDPVSGRWRLLRARNAAKDQTYFLSGLTQETLARVVFPLGGLEKAEVKQLARAAGFPELAEKPESQDFIEASDYGVLFDQEDSCAGEIVDAEGRVLGRHRGIVHYTVGQRKGLGIGGTGDPLYVTGVDAEQNRIRVGRRGDLYRRAFEGDQPNWIAGTAPAAGPRRLEGKIRQRHAGAPGVLRADGERVVFEFDEPQCAITPGQTAVFYDGDAVVGSAIIRRAL